MVVERGEIWWASLPDPVGSGPGCRRPAVIVQAQTFNRSGISTVVVALISSNLRLAEAPGNVRLPARASGLPKDSVINVSQLLTVDWSVLTECIGMLSQALLDQVDNGLRTVLEL